jgi:GT2 family glycosyltransferase
MNGGLQVKDVQISVVIPTCDRPQLVLKAVASVFNQSKPPTELIVVDNGRAALAEDCLPIGTKVIRTAPRIGISRARNVGASTATGSHIAFLDDDDIWDTDYLAHLAAGVQSGSGRIAAAQIVNLDANGRQYGSVIFPSDPSRQREVFFRNPGFTGSNFLMDRRVFVSLGGFDEKLPASEDRDLAARAIIAGEHLLSVPSAHAYVLHHSGERSGRFHLEGNVRFLLKHWSRMRPAERRQSVWRIFSRLRGSASNALRRLRT